MISVTRNEFSLTRTSLSTCGLADINSLSTLIFAATLFRTVALQAQGTLFTYQGRHQTKPMHRCALRKPTCVRTPEVLSFVLYDSLRVVVDVRMRLTTRSSHSD